MFTSGELENITLSNTYNAQCQVTTKNNWMAPWWRHYDSCVTDLFFLLLLAIFKPFMGMNFSQIALAESFVIAVQSNGRVWSFGKGFFFFLWFLLFFKEKISFIHFQENWKRSLLLFFFFSLGKFGSLGHGNKEDQPKPKMIEVRKEKKEEVFHFPKGKLFEIEPFFLF